MPFIDFLKGFLQTDDNLTRALLKVSPVIGRNFEKIIVPNINTLRAYGVPEPHIVKLFLLAHRSFLLRFDLFEKRVDAIEKMGFEPTSKSFTLAVRSMATISKSNWEKKKEILINLGWSEDEFYFAFKRQPIFVLTSVKKIEILMDFFVEKLGLKPSDIVRRPNLLLASLEGRIIPRWSVIKVLKSKKLLEKDVDVGLSLAVNSKQFEKKFVIPYMDKTPEVMKAYQGSDLPALLSSTKSVLSSSLKNNIMPFIDFLKGFLQTDENITSALLKVSPVIGNDMGKEMMPNINTLRARGVPEPHIRRLILLSPRSLFLRIDLFEKMFDEIKKIGFEPTSKMFLLAIRSMTKQPMFVLTSVKKMGILMNFLVEKFGLKPSEFVRRPNLFLVSFERRIIPRWSVIKVLKSKKLLEMDVDVGLSLAVSSMDFEKKFVIPYMDRMPEVMKAYQGGA
ncbi:hypothetical protein EZV62_020084 [Acer yangbiense]|uniref:Uncharacterized protein n=1 Tax=Acer yangbiense TaxID=1000413 RepID=A0A5C7HDE0_9ROSI|nr:hypothetical protein EZV62_020084 [Acer yangbiense]